MKARLDNREVVRMAYRLILGREPENDNVLDFEFSDFQDLRQQFMSSEEFKVVSNEFFNKQNAIKVIKNFEQFNDFVAKFQRRDFEGADFDFLRSYVLDFNAFVKLFNTPRLSDDPFSDEYAQWEMLFFEFLSGRDYSFDSEGLNESAILPYMTSPPTFEMALDTKIHLLKTHADLLNILRPTPEMSVLEMGSGGGSLLELFGRCGCRVTGLDASKGFAEYAKSRLNTQHINGGVVHGSFYDVEKLNDKFDLIIFESSFHHCCEPVRLLRILREKLSSNGKIIFVNEPMYSHYDRPWGIVRYDGEVMYQIRGVGWLELAFRPDFFEECLRLTGYKFVVHTLFDGMAVYEASKQ